MFEKALRPPGKTAAFTIMVATQLLLTSAAFAQSDLQKGIGFYQTKKFTDAEHALDRVQESSKDYATAQYYLGEIAFEKKNYDDASEYFEEASESNPKDIKYLQRLGDAYALEAANANMIS